MCDLWLRRRPPLEFYTYFREEIMTIQTYIMILLNHRVLVPQSWIDSIQISLDFETLTLSQYPSITGVPSLVSALMLNVMRLLQNSISTEQGQVFLQNGAQQVNMFWCEEG